MSNFMHFVLHPLPSTENELNEKLKDISDKFKNNSQNPCIGSVFNPIKSVPVLQCLVGHSHIALLLEDGRICRVAYSITPEKLDLSSSDTTKTPSTKNNVNPNPNSVNAPRLGARRGGRIMRTSSSSRGRGASGVIMGNRALVPVQFVPEDLISQAQVVLQGKSRTLIIKELQRTNLDVNLAVNNLLSRDDEDAEDMDDNQESYLPNDDLMSLLDAGIHNDHNSVLIDADAVFPEDVFNYSSVRVRSSNSSSRLSRTTSNDRDRDLSSLDREQLVRFGSERHFASGSSGSGATGISSSRRWLEHALRDSASASESNKASSNVPTSDQSGSSTRKKSDSQAGQANAFYVSGPLEYWQADRKFVEMISLYSELVAITSNGQLHQWKWTENEPYKCQVSEGVVIYHPKTLSLGLLNERVHIIAGSCVRASAATESNKLATWVDESIAPVASKLEHPAQLFSEFIPGDRIANLFVCSLYSCVQMEHGLIYWWGIPPFQHRKRQWEKQKSKSKKQKNNANQSQNSEIVAGAQVCLRNSPSYNAGSFAFNTSGGVPRVGQLVNAAWNITDTCTFKVLSNHELRKMLTPLPTITPMPSISKFETVKDQPASPNFSKSCSQERLEMPPPPSPASSTCSEPGVSPLPKRSKRLNNSANPSNAGKEEEKSNEENWNLKDVVFLEDPKNIIVGKVIKIDGAFAAVKFNTSSMKDNCNNTDTNSGDNLSCLLQDCRLLKKDDLQLVKPGMTNKTIDCLQKTARRVPISVMLNIIKMDVSNQGIHAIVRTQDKLSYIVFSLYSGRIEQDCLFPIDCHAFFGSDRSLINLTCYGENDCYSLLKDGNGAFYPMAKDCNNAIKDPITLDLPPIQAMGVCLTPLKDNITTTKTQLAVIVLVLENQILIPAILRSDPDVVRLTLASLDKNPVSLEVVISEKVDGNRNILHTAVSMCAPTSNKPTGNDLGVNEEFVLDNIDLLNSGAAQISNSGTSGSSLTGRGSSAGGSGSGGLHELVKRSKHSVNTRSPSIIDNHSRSSTDGALSADGALNASADTDSGLLSGNSASNGPNSSGMMASGSSMPLLNWPTEPQATSLHSNESPAFFDANEQKSTSLSVLWALTESPVTQPYLKDLMMAKNSNGYTPFMMAVNCRAYSAALHLFQVAQRISREAAVESGTNEIELADIHKQTLLSMIFPRGSNPDDSPLHVLCSNDTCSFTWTGSEHINQDIFECTTCGLVDSLCCCTECARVCHKGHDCKLKRTSPTAYCDCWEKCKCKALIAGSQTARSQLLKRILSDTDLVTLPNAKGENILLFLVQTVGRQIQEQRQHRPNRMRNNGSKKNSSGANNGGGSGSAGGAGGSASSANDQWPGGESGTGEQNTPDHDLDPPKFARKALDKIIQDWNAVKSMILTGYRGDNHNLAQLATHLTRNSQGASYKNTEEQTFLLNQNGTALLDKFTHCLLVKVADEMLDTLLVTIIKRCSSSLSSVATEARLVARRFVRSVARICVVLCCELSPTLYQSINGFNNNNNANCSGGTSGWKKNSSASQLAKCKRVFQTLLPIAVEELCEIADALIAPVRYGVARPTAPFPLISSVPEAINFSEELFLVDPLVSTHNASVSSLTSSDSSSSMDSSLDGHSRLLASGVNPSSNVGGPSNLASSLNTNSSISNNSGAVPTAHEVSHNTRKSNNSVSQSTGTDVLMVGASGLSGLVHQNDASNQSASALSDVLAGALGDDGDDVDAVDMASEDVEIEGSDNDAHDDAPELIHAEESESDSDSNGDDASYQSNVDNASAQRSTTTGATAGSESGIARIIYFSEEDTNDSSNGEDEEESETAETEPETDELNFISSELDRDRHILQVANSIVNRNTSSVSGSGVNATSNSNAGNNATGVSNSGLSGGAGQISNIPSSSSARSSLAQHLQWAFRYRDTSGAGSGHSGNNAGGTGSNGGSSASRQFANNMSASNRLMHLDASGLRHGTSTVAPLLTSSGTTVDPATAAANVAAAGEAANNAANNAQALLDNMNGGRGKMITTAVSLARAFSIVIRQLAALLPSLHNGNRGSIPGINSIALSFTEQISLLNYLEVKLKPTWEWLITVMDSTEGQLRFGCALTNSSSNLSRSNPLQSFSYSTIPASGRSSNRSRLDFSRNNSLDGGGVGSRSSASRRSNVMNVNRYSNTSSADAAYMNRRDFLSYAISLMRTHNNEHFDSLPSLDVGALKHVAYVFDALIYYMRINNESINNSRLNEAPPPVTLNAAMTGSILHRAAEEFPLDGENDITMDDSEDTDTISHVQFSVPSANNHGNVSGSSAINSIELNPIDDDSANSNSLGSSGANHHMHNQHQNQQVNNAMLNLQNAQQQLTNVTYMSKGRKHVFFQRSNSTLFLGCPPSDPFSTCLAEALPLADQPHLLQPTSRREELFGIPRSSIKQLIVDSLPSRLSLSDRFSNNVSAPASTSSGSAASRKNEEQSLFNVNDISGTQNTAQSGSSGFRQQSVITDYNQTRTPIIVHHNASGGQIVNTFTSGGITTSHKSSVIVHSANIKPQIVQNICSSSSSTTSSQTTSNQMSGHNNLQNAATIGLNQASCNLQSDNSGKCGNISGIFGSHSQQSTSLIKKPFFMLGSILQNDILLGRWRLTLELFGRVFVDDVGAEPGSIICELESFPLKEAKFRSEMERFRSLQQRDIIFSKIERDRAILIQQTFKELNAMYNTFSRRISVGAPLLAVSRVKVSFKDEQGQGSGVTRSFYTAFCEAVLSSEKLPALDLCQVGSRTLQYNLIQRLKSKDREREQQRRAYQNHRPIQSSRNSGMFAMAMRSERELGTVAQLRYEAPTFVMPGDPQSGSAQAANGASGSSGLQLGEILTPHRQQLGMRLYPRVSQLRPSLASKITGMLLELPPSSLLTLFSSEEAFRNKVEEAVDIILANGRDLSNIVSNSTTNNAVASVTNSIGSAISNQNSVHQAGTSSSGSTSIASAVNSSVANNSSSGSAAAHLYVSSEHAANNSSAELLDLDMFNLSARNVNTSSAHGQHASSSHHSNSKHSTGKLLDFDDDDDSEDNSPLFYQPGKRGFYSPRQGKCTPERLNAFRNVGRIVGICLLQNELCPICFNRHVIKYILRKPIAWHDLAFFDPILYESVRKLMLDAENSKDADALFASLDLRFSVDLSPEEGGGHVDLIPNGRNIEVNAVNIYDYVRRYALYRMVKCQERALQCLRQGIFDALPPNALDSLTAEDFRLLLNGVGEINIQQLINWTTFNEECGEDSPSLQYLKKWFWSIVEKMTNQEKQDLVYFWTGSPALPASEEGFNPMPTITIRSLSDQHLPTANTCINKIYLPIYTSKANMRNKMLTAIKFKNFGFV